MNLIWNKINQINQAYADYRSNNTSKPTHFILDIEARQALKLQLVQAGIPSEEIKEYLGIPIISKEEVVIV